MNVPRTCYLPNGGVPLIHQLMVATHTHDHCEKKESAPFVPYFKGLQYTFFRFLLYSFAPSSPSLGLTLSLNKCTLSLKTPRKGNEGTSATYPPFSACLDRETAKCDERLLSRVHLMGREGELNDYCSSSVYFFFTSLCGSKVTCRNVSKKKGQPKEHRAEGP